MIRDFLHRIAAAPPRYTSIMVAGSGGIGAGVARVQKPMGLPQRLARWLLKRPA
jgi:hypothetical protein